MADLLDEVKQLKNELKLTRDELGTLRRKIETIRVFSKRKSEYVLYDSDDFHQDTFNFRETFKLFSKSVFGLVSLILILLQILNLLLIWIR